MVSCKEILHCHRLGKFLGREVLGYIFGLMFCIALVTKVPHGNGNPLAHFERTRTDLVLPFLEQKYTFALSRFCIANAWASPLMHLVFALILVGS